MKKKKTLYILIAIIIISITTTSSSAYFNSKLGLGDILGNEGDKNTLNITNGDISLNFDQSEAEWKAYKVDGTSINLSSNIGESEIPGDDTSELEAEYKYVYLNNNSNLTSNINLKLYYGMNSSVKPSVSSSVEIVPTEPFEVFVGDIDNSNAGFNGTFDAYYGKYNESYRHGTYMDIYPSKYDANATDRRMVTSGFYNTIASITNTSDSSKFYSNLASKIDTNDGYLTGYHGTSYYLLKLSSNYEDTGNGINLKKGHQLWCDYYTYGPLKGIAMTNASNELYKEQDPNIPTNVAPDNLNWRYMQSVKDLEFKYKKIPSDEEVVSAQIAIYFDDLQSGLAHETRADQFSAVSQNRYSAYLIDDTGTYSVPEWDESLNGTALDGPLGYIFALNVPERLLPLIKENTSFKLRIDDNTFGSTGDSYTIDFAKLIVNKPSIITNSSITINGIVSKPDGTPIEGAVVTSGDGGYAITGVDGKYSLQTGIGVVSLNCSHSNYDDVATVFYADVNKTYNFKFQTLNVMSEDESSEDTDKNEKFKVNVKVEEYYSDTDIWKEISLEEPNDSVYIDNKKENEDDGELYEYLYLDGTQVQSVSKILAAKPNTKYRISYKVIASSRNYISKSALKSFYSEFFSTLTARAVQENSPGWDENGSDYNDYLSNFVNGNRVSGASAVYINVNVNADLGSDIDNINKAGFIEIRNSKTKEVIASKSISGSNPKHTFQIVAGDNYEVVLKSHKYEEVIVSLKDSLTSSTPDGTIITKDIKPSISKVTEVYFEKPINVNATDFNSAVLYTSLTYKEINSSYSLISNYSGTQETAPKNEAGDIGWYWALANRYTENNPDKKYSVQVKCGSSYDSKPIYAVTTDRVFICTNGFDSKSEKDFDFGSDIEKGEVTIKCVDGNGNLITSKTSTGAIGKTYTITAENVITAENGDHYILNDTNTTISGTYTQDPQEKTIKYIRANVTINYLDENGTQLANSEHRYIENGTYNVNEGSIAVSSSAETKLTNYNYVKTTVGNNSTSVSTVTINGTDVVINYIYKLKGVIIHYYNTTSYKYIYAYDNSGDISDYKWNDTIQNQFDKSENGWDTKIIQYTGSSLKVIFHTDSKQEPASGQDGYSVSGETWIKDKKVYYSAITVNYVENGTIIANRIYVGNVGEVATINDTILGYESSTQKETFIEGNKTISIPVNKKNNVKVVHYKNNSNWSSVYAYAWDINSNSSNGSFPGILMVNEGNNWWGYEVTNNSWNKIIFALNDKNQTSDLYIPSNNESWYATNWIDSKPEDYFR